MLSTSTSSVVAFCGSGVVFVMSTVNVTGPPGSGMEPTLGVFTTLSVTSGTSIGMLNAASQRHLEGAPGNASSGLAQTSLAPGCRQLVQLGMFRKPSPSVSVQTAVRFWIATLLGLLAALMSP